MKDEEEFEELVEYLQDELIEDELIEEYPSYEDEYINNTRIRNKMDYQKNNSNENQNQNRNSLRDNLRSKRNKENQNNDASKKNNEINDGKTKTSALDNSIGKLNTAKNIIDDPKNTAKEVAKKAIKEKLIQFLLSPAGLYFLGAIGLIIFFMVMLILLTGDYYNSGTSGIKGYNYLAVAEANQTFTVTYDGEVIDKGVTLNDAVAVILYSEVGIFKDEPELLKSQAVAIRSYVLYNSSDGIINGNMIAYKTVNKQYALSDDSVFKQAVQETNGEILSKNDKLAAGYFAAMCYYDTITDENGNEIYQIHYGGESFTTQDSEIQEIPKENLDSYKPSASWFQSYCYGNHGEGMSQYGAYYLAKEKGYSYTQILDYYYFNEYEIKTYIAGGTYENYNSKAIADEILFTPLRTFLKEKGSSMTEYNDYIYSSAANAGIGTREAVVAVALTYTAYMYESYNVRFPYTLSGGNSGWSYYEGIGKRVNNFYGADPDWGTTYSGSGFSYGGYSPFLAFGMDCSTYISWALKNAGFIQNSVLSANFKEYGDRYHLGDGYLNYTPLPGDLVWQEGHILIIVGVDLENDLLYVSHATGGYSRSAVIDTLSTKTASGRYVVSMEEYYQTKDRYEASEFKEIYYSGLLS